MKHTRKVCSMVFAIFAVLALVAGPAQAADKPNIVVIMGDDIGWFNIGAYHQGMMVGRTPNLDKLAAEGMRFTDYYAEASCTAGRAAFVTGELPIRTGMTTVGQAAKLAMTALEYPPMQKGAELQPRCRESEDRGSHAETRAVVAASNWRAAQNESPAVICHAPSRNRPVKQATSRRKNKEE